ncbi:FAD-dependent oxidoreductase [Micropruina sonneratiae]|uniref:FAD-dependent oxidoreductase n=1 Tax=Micropruina sonneratiae TaxID=2986940 RepID=UPI0022261FFD|nr:FAD-dependent oxidoreductase [Micropruina sp. KQZ13P-5]MCW3157565.1 FAD-dependent oxidoreductase [Micropruina sp. KQZ13P-5]
MTHRTLDIAVIGAGPTGLTAALLLARDGHRAVICEAEDPQEAGTRPGVSQFRLPHVVLPRWHHEMAVALPDLIPALRAAGASPFNLLHCQGDRVTGGRQPGDEQFDTVAISRVLLEQVLGGLAADQPGLELCRATSVTGLLPATDATGVRGLRTEHGTLPAVVVDAGGRRSPVPGSLQRLFGMPVTERRSATRLTFYGRHFESTGAAPPRPRPILTHYPSG